MKSWLFGCVCASFFVFLCDVASAGAWATSGGFGIISGGRFASVTPTSGALTGNLSVTDFSTNGLTFDHTDAFADIPISTMIFAGRLDLIANPSPNFPNLNRFVSVGTSVWGQFSGRIDSDYTTGTAGAPSGGGTATRVISIFGRFSVGSDPIYMDGPAAMDGSYLSITFTRTNSGSVSARWVLDTTGASPVPEPTSIAIFGSGLVACVLRRRTRQETCIKSFSV